MPSPTKVQLVPYNPSWPAVAEEESNFLATALGGNLVAIHHIGSTAISGIAAKPIIDLMPVVRDLAVLDQNRRSVEDLGYGWRGEYGLPGRRYCIKDDPQSGHRLFQLHCYQDGSPAVDRHLAFRDCLRRDPALAKEYEAEKRRCQVLHPHDSHAYTDCKSDWIKRVERAAVRKSVL